MKADDIPQLVYISGGFNLSLRDIEDWLVAYNEKYGINIDPDFQRPFSPILHDCFYNGYGSI